MNIFLFGTESFDSENNNIDLDVKYVFSVDNFFLLLLSDAAMVVEECETSGKVWRVREKAYHSQRQENISIQVSGKG